MSERSEIINRDVGYKWRIEVERELRTESGAKYPDKTVVNVSLEGNELSFDTTKIMLESARQVALDKIKKVEQLGEESDKTKP